MRSVVFYFFCLLIPVAARCQFSPLTSSKDTINFISKEKILADLDDYAEGIAHKHVQPFTHIKKHAFFEEIKKMKDSADKYDIDGLLIQLLKVNAMIEDEHTNVVYNSRDQFPFSCYWFKEGIFIIGAEDEHMDLLFAQVVAVNGVAINDVADMINTLNPTKNLPGLKKILPNYLFDPFVIHGLQIAPSKTNVEYTLVTANNDTIKLKSEAKDRRTIKIRGGLDNNVLLKNSKRGNYWFKYIDTSNCLYFKYTHCYDEDKDHLFADFEKELVKEVETRKPDKIVIDMRDNGGGYPRLLGPFINTLSRSALNKKGKIDVLIGRRTFSAAIINSTELKTQTYAQLIGEETSGDVVFYASVHYFKLPNTGLMISYSTSYWTTDEKYDGSLRPDILIPVTLADYKHGVDAALNYALTH